MLGISQGSEKFVTLIAPAKEGKTRVRSVLTGRGRNEQSWGLGSSRMEWNELPSAAGHTLTQAVPSPHCWVLGPLVFSPGETSPKRVRLAKCGPLSTVETCEIC